MNERLASEKRYQNACRDPTMASGLDLKRQFVAPLAKKVSPIFEFLLLAALVLPLLTAAYPLPCPSADRGT